jgi:hypothetical protein
VNTRRQPALVSRELVEDLNLKRWVRPTNHWGDWYHIDRRRLARELRKLPKLRGASRARFMAEVQNDRSYRHSTHAMAKFVLLDEFGDVDVITDEVKARLLRWWDQALEQSMRLVSSDERMALYAPQGSAMGRVTVDPATGLPLLRLVSSAADMARPPPKP